MTSRLPRRALALQRVALVAIVVMAVLWGSTFFSLKALLTRLPVSDLLAVRFTIAAVVLGVVGWRAWRMTRRTLVQGLVLGAIFTAAQLFQTYGLGMTSASVSGFLTGLYVVFTPLLSAFVLRDRVRGTTWLAVALATVGLGVLSLNLSGGFPLGGGELLTLVSAVLFGAHIVATGHFSTRENALSLTLVQTAFLAFALWFFALPGGVQWPTGLGDWLWTLYLAVLCGAVTIFLQMWAQAHVEPTRAAVIMCTEPAWAAVFALWFGGEHLTWRMVVGGLAILAAMMLVIILPILNERRSRRG